MTDTDDWFDYPDIELECERCHEKVTEGFQPDEYSWPFWCSLECMAADGYDTANAYSTASELDDEEPPVT